MISVSESGKKVGSSELGRWTAATAASVASGLLTVITVLPLSFPTALDPSFVSPPSPPVTLSPYSLTAVLTKHFPPSGCFCANYTDAAYVHIKHLLSTIREFNLETFTLDMEIHLISKLKWLGQTLRYIDKIKSLF